MRRRVGFLFLVVLFTLFGAGRSHFWREVIADQSGCVYFVDDYSIRTVNLNSVECTVKAVRGDRSFVDGWTLDADRMTLTRDSEGTPEQIGPHSVASHFLIFFREEGDLPLSSSPQVVKGGR